MFNANQYTKSYLEIATEMANGMQRTKIVRFLSSSGPFFKSLRNIQFETMIYALCPKYLQSLYSSKATSSPSQPSQSSTLSSFGIPSFRLSAPDTLEPSANQTILLPPLAFYLISFFSTFYSFAIDCRTNATGVRRGEHITAKFIKEKLTGRRTIAISGSCYLDVSPAPIFILFEDYLGFFLSHSDSLFRSNSTGPSIPHPLFVSTLNLAQQALQPTLPSQTSNSVLTNAVQSYSLGYGLGNRLSAPLTAAQQNAMLFVYLFLFVFVLPNVSLSIPQLPSMELLWAVQMLVIHIASDPNFHCAGTEHPPFGFTTPFFGIILDSVLVFLQSALSRFYCADLPNLVYTKALSDRTVTNKTEHVQNSIPPLYLPVAQQEEKRRVETVADTHPNMLLKLDEASFGVVEDSFAAIIDFFGVITHLPHIHAVLRDTSNPVPSEPQKSNSDSDPSPPQLSPQRFVTEGSNLWQYYFSLNFFQFRTLFACIVSSLACIGRFGIYYSGTSVPSALNGFLSFSTLPSPFSANSGFGFLSAPQSILSVDEDLLEVFGGEVQKQMTVSLERQRQTTLHSSQTGPLSLSLTSLTDPKVTSSPFDGVFTSDSILRNLITKTDDTTRPHAQCVLSSLTRFVNAAIQLFNMDSFKFLGLNRQPKETPSPLPSTSEQPHPIHPMSRVFGSQTNPLSQSILLVQHPPAAVATQRSSRLHSSDSEAETLLLTALTLLPSYHRLSHPENVEQVSQLMQTIVKEGVLTHSTTPEIRSRLCDMYLIRDLKPVSQTTTDIAPLPTVLSRVLKFFSSISDGAGRLWNKFLLCFFRDETMKAWIENRPPMFDFSLTAFVTKHYNRLRRFRQGWWAIPDLQAPPESYEFASLVHINQILCSVLLRLLNILSRLTISTSPFRITFTPHTSPQYEVRGEKMLSSGAIIPSRSEDGTGIEGGQISEEPSQPPITPTSLAFPSSPPLALDSSPIAPLVENNAVIQEETRGRVFQPLSFIRKVRLNLRFFAQKGTVLVELIIFVIWCIIRYNS
ncbi:hypothetical protein BLNAU_11521 [Blattamonas nauphoetae]|uniref:Uncharacterized protein n=1 Tax=Blattamonas nauphoetae TaxID=2049346 RepID=A0ABQ9XN97_9EUKA|nr:hypothetical protein BLNAU_11521 [Blattamonas nauphoetae]